MKKTLLLALAAATWMCAGATMPLRPRLPRPMQLWYDRPANYFEESLPIGNGKLGALVYGAPDDDIIYLNDITLWTGTPVDQREDAGAAAWIPKIREALFAEDYARADSLQLHVQGHNSQYYQPLATLHVRDGNRAPVVAYRRRLSLDSALVNIAYRRGNTAYEREYFASHPDRAVAMRLKASVPGGLDQELTLTAQVPHRAKASANAGTGRGWQGQLTLTGHAEGDPRQSIHFCTQLLVRTVGGRVEARDSTLHITGATEAEIYIVNETSFNGARNHPVTQGAPYIETVTDEAWHLVNYSYEELRQRHLDDYAALYNRLSLWLEENPGDNEGNPLAVTTDALLLRHSDTAPSPYLETLYFQYGRYLLISSSRTPGVPANLQGLWTPHKWSPWRGNYTMNINLEENYWPAFTANLAEMAAPLDDFIAALAENGHHTARHYYGIDQGWCASHNSDIWAMTNPVGEKNEKPEWANWNMGGAWMVHTLWERYLFTQDADYLRRVAFPLMMGAARFCLDWLTENPRVPGELITAPSTSPENEYVTDRGYHGMTCYGGTADLAIIRELLINTLKADDVVNGQHPLDAETMAFRKRAADALQRLHPYTVGREGDLNEWYYDWNDFDPHHRHQSHLIGLYPGNHLTDPALQQAAAKTLEQKGDHTTGWSTGWRINLWARLHNGEKAYQTLRKLLTYVSPDNYEGPGKRRSGGTYPNLMDAHPPFQIDGNFGGTAGICEMLVQSTTDNGHTTIELLPALPQQWQSGEVRGLAARGGYTVTLRWMNGRPAWADITAKNKGTLTVVYNGKAKKAKARPGKTIHLKW